MIQELDIVSLTHDIPEENLKTGQDWYGGPLPPRRTSVWGWIHGFRRHDHRGIDPYRCRRKVPRASDTACRL